MIFKLVLIIIVTTMYIDAAYSTQGGKTYRRYLLRESYRHEGKVKHRTIANLSHCSEEEIAAIKLALRHKGDLAQLGSVKELNASTGRQDRRGLLFKGGGPSVLGSPRS